MCFKAKTGVATTTVSSTPIDPAPLMNTVSDQGVIFGDGSETSNDTGTKSLTNNLDSTDTSSDSASQLKNTSTSTSDVSNSNSNSTSTKKKTSAITSTNSL